MDFFKRKFPILVVFVSGLLMIIAYYVPHKPFDQVEERASSWYMIISSFALVLAFTSLIRSHYLKIREGKLGWGYSMVMFLALIVTTVFGVLPYGKNHLFGTRSGTIYMWIFDYVNTPAAATVFSLLAFYIASAAYRAFRVRTIDATIMLITAMIVMIGRVPWGEMFSEFMTSKISHYLVFVRLDRLTSFLLNYPTVAARRAVYIGIALATVATSLRVILGVERTYMGSDE
ncbi:MAG: hypothetical protein NT106_02255 [Candidatus Sumerlaeota bacterium]|nr:hypothetical protein [Candidatus Sumerlaeota bacterium]